MDHSENADKQAHKPSAAVVLESDLDGVFDALVKLEDHKARDDIDYLLFVSSDKKRVLMFFRTEHDWSSQSVTLNGG